MRKLKISIVNYLVQTLSIAVLIIISTGCATIVSHSVWPLTIETTPSGARVEVTDKTGKVVFNGNSPAYMSLKSGSGYFKSQSYLVKISMEGYETNLIPVECKLNGWYVVGNFFVGGLTEAHYATYCIVTSKISENLVIGRFIDDCTES